MSDTTKCPKCSAERKPHWTGWECGSSQFTHGQEFTQSLGCRIAELTQQLAEVTAERDAAKELHYDTNTSLLESQASHEYTLSLLTAARAELAECKAKLAEATHELAIATQAYDDEAAACAAAVRQWNESDLRNEKRHREWNEQLIASQAEAARLAERVRVLTEAAKSVRRWRNGKLALGQDVMPSDVSRLLDDALDASLSTAIPGKPGG